MRLLCAARVGAPAPHADAALLAAQGDRPLLAQARAQVFRDGYSDQLGELWGADGQLLAGTQQIQYFKT